jgi:lipopolysaccharide transport system permease protein
MTDTSFETEPSPLPLRVYRPVKRRIRLMDLWTSRGVARMIGVRDVKVKYKQAALGPVWLLVAPLGMLAAMTIAFSGVTKVHTGGVPYVIFALVGLTVWTFIQLSLTLCAGTIVANATLVRRSPVPRLALITGALLGNLPPVTVMLTVTLVSTVVVRGLPLQALLLPVLIAWLAVFTLSLSLLLGALAARFRDVISALPLVVQAGLFVSPVGYPIQGAPANIQTFLTINPVSGLIEAWRWCLLGQPGTQWGVIAVSGAMSVVLVVLAWRVFGRLEAQFADFV